MRAHHESSVTRRALCRRGAGAEYLPGAHSPSRGVRLRIGWPGSIIDAVLGGESSADGGEGARIARMRMWVLAGMALVAAAVVAGVWGLQATGAGSVLADDGSALPAWWYALSTTGILLVWSSAAVLPSGDVAGLDAKPVRGIGERSEANEEVLAVDVPLDSSAGRWIAIASTVALGVAMVGCATLVVRARSGR